MGCCCGKEKKVEKEEKSVSKKGQNLKQKQPQQQNGNESTNPNSPFKQVSLKQKQEILERLEDDPNDPDAIANYGIILSLEGKEEEAISNLKKAIDLDSDRSKSWMAYAEFYERKNNPEKAQEIYSQGYKHASPKIALDNDDSNLMLNYAINLQNSKEYDKAEKLFKRVVTSGPSYAEGSGRYAMFLLEVRKDVEKANLYYKQAADIDPPHPEWNQRYAVFLRDIQKNQSESSNYFKRSSLYV
eukprot:gene1411-1780_t